MVNVDEAVICRFKKGDKEFEILVDPDKALDFRKEVENNLDNILAVPGVYHDVRRGDSIPDDELQRNFGTLDAYKIARIILKEGELQFTTEQRRRFVEEKTKEIANIISRRGINPQTNTPHPPQRILNGMEQIGIHVDPFLDASAQVDRIVKDLKVILPIKFESVKVQITIPSQFAGRAYSEIKRLFKDSAERWLNDGSLQLIVQIPAGMEGELLEKVGSITKGNFTSKTIERSG
ncbi:MAG: ribosome assembly factor SBDS [Candidatus Aenigmarchaeota archaeon]|nr:ribosome assembly factor SBDS [Candidatus Aenigmarchaeota archaeon]